MFNVVDRPGIGPVAATSGSACTVEANHEVLEFGYRNEVDRGSGGTSILSSYPMTVLRLGIDKRDEVVLLTPSMALRAGMAGSDFTPAIGTEDSGIGWKRNIHGRAWFQDSVNVFMTYPTGTNGYSAGEPTFSLSYNAAISIGAKFGLSGGMGLGYAPGELKTGGERRFVSYQPFVTVTYSIDSKTSVFANDNLSIPSTPSGGTSNVLLVAFQRSLSPGTVLDVETEFNLTPTAGYNERAIGVGGAFYI